MLSMCNLREAGVSIDTADGMTPLGWTVVNDRKQTALQLVKAFRYMQMPDQLTAVTYPTLILLTASQLAQAQF